MKQFICISLFSLVVFSGQSQSISMMGDAPKGVLFRNYDNVVEVNDNLTQNRVFVVEFVGGELQVIQSNDGTVSTGRYLLTPTDSETEFIVRDEEGNEMNRAAFKTNRVPETEVGFATSNGAFSADVNILVPVNKAFPYFEKMHEIYGWSLIIAGQAVAEGNGNRLDSFAMDKISQLPIGADFVLQVQLLDVNGVTRLKSVSFQR